MHRRARSTFSSVNIVLSLSGCALMHREKKTRRKSIFVLGTAHSSRPSARASAIFRLKRKSFFTANDKNCFSHTNLEGNKNVSRENMTGHWRLSSKLYSGATHVPALQTSSWRKQATPQLPKCLFGFHANESLASCRCRFHDQRACSES